MTAHGNETHSVGDTLRRILSAIERIERHVSQASREPSSESSEMFSDTRVRFKWINRKQISRLHPVSEKTISKAQKNARLRPCREAAGSRGFLYLAEDIESWQREGYPTDPLPPPSERLHD